jgi:hypothetical protein
MMSILCTQYEWVKTCNIGAKGITLEMDYKSFFHKKQLLHINEILNEFFCNLFLKILKFSPMHHIFLLVIIE